MARTADLMAKMTLEKVEREVESMQQAIQAQKTLSVQEAQAAKSAQDAIAKQLQEAQKAVQATANLSQRYEEQLSTLTEKMMVMERLLIEQRQKGQRLESKLSSAQDRIGGAERRARSLEEENTKIKAGINITIKRKLPQKVQ